MNSNDQTNKQKSKWTDIRFYQSILLIGLLALIITLPVFAALYKFVPEIRLFDIQLDYILLFTLSFALIYFFLKQYRVIVLTLCVAGLGTLTVLNLAGVYTMKEVYADYQNLLSELKKNSGNKIYLDAGKFARRDQIKESIDYNNPIVRNFATQAAVAYFENERLLSPNPKWGHYMSVFAYVYSRWNYVYDPKYEEYYAKASETVEQIKEDGKFKGDCDDYSILMAALIKDIGGEVRLVRTIVERSDGNKIGHIYPEVKIGDKDDLEKFTYLVQYVFFEKESKDKKIHYYEDQSGVIWVNFDYNDAYPGGRYQSTLRTDEITI